MATPTNGQEEDIAAAGDFVPESIIESDTEVMTYEEEDIGNQDAEPLIEEASVMPYSQEEQTDSEVVDSEMEVHIIDLGQGDATLIKSGDGIILIDTAESTMGTAIQNYLNKQGITKLDYLILTHPDADHIGSAPVIINKFEIDNIFVSDFEKDNRTYQKLVEALDYKRIVPIIPDIGSAYILGEISFTILAPTEDYTDPNNASIVLMVNHSENSFLFTGDAEAEAEADILDSGSSVDADVYKVGHHGSSTSSSGVFLEGISPEYAVISCGEDNSYGHPHAEILNNLRTMGVIVFRTDEQGTLVVSSDGEALSWNIVASVSWIAGEPTQSSQQTAEVDDGNSNSERDSVTSSVFSPVREMPVKTEIQPEPVISVVITAQPLPTEEPVIIEEELVPESSGEFYVLNVETKKFHIPSCSYLPTTNRQDTNMSREEVLAQGYVPCKRCNP
ncbi:MAG: MBL fold metallo-hydrolase [Lachnospiraceae bacterium]|nr:MBL fold metallo-hydrolase [Lachnospiraceae bacterium]